MPGARNSIRVNKDDEKRLFRIMKELEYSGESLIVDASGPEWNGTLRKFGIRAKPLIERDLIEPIWVQYTSGKTMEKNRLIRTKKAVIVEEIPCGRISEFYFKPIDVPEKRRRLM